MHNQQLDETDPDDDRAVSLFDGLALPADDLQAVLNKCTRAEQRVYAGVVLVARLQPDPEFADHGYHVANARLLQGRRHGRLKAHIASLVAKNAILPLNPPFSRCQRYLVGCHSDGADYFLTWIEDCRAWRLPLEREPDPVSKRGRRPSAAETPESLKNLGFLPCRPSTPTLNRENKTNRGPQSTGRAQKTPAASLRRGKLGSSTFQQRLVLANEIANCAGLTPIANGKDGKLLDWLNKTFGFDQALTLIHEAWSKRDSLLTADFPMFTAQTVNFYARFHRKSNRSNQQRKVSLQTMVHECTNERGEVDYDRLGKRISLYGLQGSPMVYSACEELGIDPGRLFSS